MKKILEWLTGGVLKDIGAIIDDLHTTEEEKLALKHKIQTAVFQNALASDQLRAAIIQEEAKGNWLQRSWRPVLMLAFGFVVLFDKAIYPTIRALNPALPELPIMEGDFWLLLQIGIGGYIVGRSAEKIAPNLKITKQ